MNDYLLKQIETRRSRIASLDRERVRLAAELAAYEDALANADGGSHFTITSPKSRAQQMRLLPVFGAWRAILQRLLEFKHFNGSDVLLIAQKLYDEGVLKKPVTNDGARAQLSLYAKKRIIKRLGGGNYCVSEQTRAALSFPSDGPPAQSFREVSLGQRS